MQPHSLSPHVVFAQDPPPFRDSVYPPRPGGQHFHGTSLSELLSEPPLRSQSWISAVYARLVVASTGPVLVSGEGPLADRLERARWFRVAADADMEAARAGAWPALTECQALNVGCGSLAPDLVIVAERDPYDRLPLFARSGVWMFRALRALGYDELTVYVTNALDRDSRSTGAKLARLHEVFATYDPQWLALGAISHEVLTGQGIEHRFVDHPAHHRRFSFAEGVEGYAKRIEESGIPRRAQPLPFVEGRPDLAERLGIPLSVTAKLNPGSKQSPGSVPAPVLDKARMKFVLGECKTVQEAAKAASDDKVERKKIVKLARSQGWEIERERFFAEKREKSKSNAAEAEARKVGESRTLAWDALSKMLKKLNDDLDKPDASVYAKDAKALGDLALGLSEKGDASFDDEKKRLEGLTPEAFTDELRKTLEGFGMKSDPKPAP